MTSWHDEKLQWRRNLRRHHSKAAAGVDDESARHQPGHGVEQLRDVALADVEGHARHQLHGLVGGLHRVPPLACGLGGGARVGGLAALGVARGVEGGPSGVVLQEGVDGVGAEVHAGQSVLRDLRRCSCNLRVVCEDGAGSLEEAG